MSISDSLIELRLLLTKNCDGFSSNLANKSTPLTTRIKILYALRDGDATPTELVGRICLAKSNLANLLKVMTNDGVVISYKTAENTKNIYYRATQKGVEELKNYQIAMLSNFGESFKGDDKKLSNYLQDIIQLLKGKDYDKNL